MAFVIVNAGESAVLEDGVTGVAYTLRLFTVDPTAGLTPDEIDALDETDFTEATFTGYTPVALSTGDWSIEPGSPTRAVHVAQDFTSTADQAPQTIRGYYVTRTSDGALMWFEVFHGPVVIEFDLDQITMVPTLTLDDREGNDVQPGTITAFGGTAAPAGWLLCDGSAVSRTTHAALFAVIGAAYGPGDGSTTFNLPDLRQRVPLGLAASGTGSGMGDTGGAIDHTHDLGPGHALLTFAAGSPYVRMFRRGGVTPWNQNNEITTSLALSSAGGSNSTAVALGGSSAVNNPPFIVVNFMIKA